jgi:hypothetical protein
MELKHVVVDGSNIATEGRSLPSLKQLDEAVRAFLAENTTEIVTVIVDATFGHRIDAKERAEYEEAILAGELITPPAGAIGRGDKFVLQIADRADAVILSNDSFQEFHGEYTWLFDEGRLIGGKPVPGVGWVFLLRTPVRGPTSRRAVRDARGGSTSSSGSSRPRRGRRSRGEDAGPANAPKVSSAKLTAPPIDPAVVPVNDPLPFIEFVANHPVGSIVEGEVARFASHGAYISAGGANCYIGLKFMGDPPPRSAKDVMTLGEVRPFAVHAFDTPRRGIDLLLVATHNQTDAPEAQSEGPDEVVSEETASKSSNSSGRRRGGRGGRGRSNAQRNALSADQAGDEDSGADVNDDVRASVDADDNDSKDHILESFTATNSPLHKLAEEAPVTPAKKKAVAKKAPAKKRAVAKKAPAKKKAVAKKAPAKKKAVAKKAPAKKRATARR